MSQASRSRIIRWSAWLVAGVLLLAVAPVAFFTAAPGACVTCHRQRNVVATVDTAAHKGADASCVACHVGSGSVERVRFGFYEAYGMAIPLVATRGSAVSTVRDEACRSCHDGLAGVQTANGLRIAHAKCAKGSACVDCHSVTAHAHGVGWPTTYHMDYCLRCHNTQKVSASCETCHVGKESRERPSTGPWAITHGANWRKTHGSGDMATCSACHPSDYCTPCHGPGLPHEARFFEGHGVTSLAKGATCKKCHSGTFCTDCHGLEMPHPRGFVKGHSALVNRTSDDRCLTCHVKGDCDGCHVKHIHTGGAVPRPSLPKGGQ